MTAPISLDLQVTVLEPDKTPAVGIPLRVVLGSALTWQAADEGERLVTGNDGTCALQGRVSLEERRHKMPTNFFSSLVSSRERTRHLQVAIELEWAARPWLTAIGIDHFENGTTTQLDPMRVFGRAANGRFTDDIPFREGSRHARLPKGVVMPVPGFDLSGVTLDPDPSAPGATRWMLRMILTRWPAPVVRD